MCAMTAEDRASSPDPFDDGELEAPRPRRDGTGRLFVVVLGLGVIALAGLGVYMKFFSAVGSESGRAVLTTPVKRGDMVVTVTEDGNVESAKNLELKCEVSGSSTILDIIPDGTHVEKGDQLVRLDASTIEDQVSAQLILAANAEAKKITEERNYAAAKIAVDEYREGTFAQGMEQCEADIVVARQNLSTAENQLHYTEKMNRKGYATPLELESKQYAVEQATLNLKVAETKKMVLEKYTKAKTLEAGAVIEPFTVGYNALFECASRIKPGAYATVFGAGSIGLAVIQLLRATGAVKVLCFEKSAGRRALATKVGAHAVHDGENAAAIILEATGGQGADVQVECAGAFNASIPQMEKAASNGSQIIVIGRDSKTVPLFLENYQCKKANMIGAMGNTGYGTYPNVIRMMAAGLLDPTPMVTDRLPLEQFEQALARAKTRQGGKVLLLMNPPTAG